MENSKASHINKSKKSYRVSRPTQTGFSSPATHYTEPRIDLNDVLVENQSATFFVRVIDEAYEEFNIFEKDVLIIDKSLTPKDNQLIVVIQDDAFKIIRFSKTLNIEFQLWGVITYVIKYVL
ncbi:S24 family peptidase [Winogradskyella litorisediminis]|uniref:S24 family peptidase n=1 Tax=Winogradskyella litorisediminis TaxID=1156618 RepID=A0ABW3N718_9FLAO